MGGVAELFLTPGELRYLYDIEKRVKALMAAIEASERNPGPRLITFGWPVGQRIPEYWGTYLNMMLNEWREGGRTLTTPALVDMGERVLELVATWAEWERRLFWIALQRKTWRQVKVAFVGEKPLRVLRRQYEYELACVALKLSATP